VYGLTTCCKCKRAKNEITAAYGPGSVTFYDINSGDNGTVLYKGVFEKFPEFTNIVPIIGVTYNGSLIAVIQGYDGLSTLNTTLEQALQYGFPIVVYANGNFDYISSDDVHYLEVVFKENRLP